MAYFGKEFVLSSQENFKEFLYAVGDDLSEEVKQAVLKHKGTVKLEKNAGGKYTITSSKPDGSLKKTTFTSGVPFEDELNGTKATTTITLDGDKLTTVMDFGEDRVLTLTREFSDDQVVTYIRATGFDGVAKRIYKP